MSGIVLPALTIRQPYASLIALGLKRNETRSWRTAHRGPLVIHAASAVEGYGRVSTHKRRAVRQFGPYEVERDSAHGLLLRGPGLAWPYRLPLGAVVAVASLVDVKVVGGGELRPDDVERALGVYEPGWFGWQLGSVSRVPTVRHVHVKGGQGLWRWTLPDAVNETLLYPVRP